MDIRALLPTLPHWICIESGGAPLKRRFANCGSSRRKIKLPIAPQRLGKAALSRAAILTLGACIWALITSTVVGCSPGGPQKPLTQVELETVGLTFASAGDTETELPGPALTPGSETPAPSLEPIGEGLGATAKAIARWDVVPYQTFRSEFTVGVVAFHRRGIDRVEFSANGGPWVGVEEMRVNPRTEVAEYFVKLRAQDFPPGLVTVRAVAYPEAGIPRELPPLELTAASSLQKNLLRCYIGPTGEDSGKSDGSAESPYRTARYAASQLQKRSPDGLADGGVILCLPGDHALSTKKRHRVTTSKRWLTIRPAPGVSREEVRITDCGKNLQTDLVRLQDVTIATGIASGFHAKDIASGKHTAYMWFDHCVLRGKGRTTQTSSIGIVGETRFTEYYATDCIVRDNKLGLKGAALARRVHCEQLGSDAFSNAFNLIHCSVNGIDNTGTKWHPDVIQWTRPRDNVIIYNLHAVNIKAQGLFAKPEELDIHNVAVVNCVIHQIGNGYKSEWEPASHHFLLWNCTFVNQTWIWSSGLARDVSIRNCVFDRFLGRPSPDWDVRNNHYRSGDMTPGKLATRGGTNLTLYADPAALDFRAKPGSPLMGSQRGEGAESPVSFDLNGRPVLEPGSVGAMQSPLEPGQD